MAAKLNLDKLDLQIIHEMMETAEISYAELGKKLFVSGGTIHVRIKKLHELKIVKGTRLNVDLRQLGYDITAFVGIYLEKSSLYDSVAKDLESIPEIVRLNYITGNYSMFLEIVYFALSGGDLSIGIGWTVLFILINAYQLYVLLRDRWSLRLPEKEGPLLREALHGLDDSQISRLLKATEWIDCQVGDVLTTQDAPVDALYFMCSGRATVAVENAVIAHLEKGAFVGEIAYLTGNAATATVTIEEPSRLLKFSKMRMAKVTGADDQINGIIYQLLGRDLALKMRRSNTERVLQK